MIVHEPDKWTAANRPGGGVKVGMRALVLCSNPVFSLGIVRSLGAMGAKGHVMGSHRVARTRFSRYCEQYVYIPDADLRSPSAVLERINQHCARYGIDVVIAGDLAATFLMAESHQHVSVPVFPVASVEVLQTLHDKWRFHWMLTSLGLPSPRTHRLDPGESLDTLPFGYPVMAKPPSSEGGDRVARYDSREALEAMLARPGARNIPWLLQEFLPGRDIDLSLLADRGKIVAWTIQDDGKDGFKIFKPEERILHVGERIVAATNFSGVAHFDMRIDERDGNLVVIECNPRFWGSLILSTWSGVNFVEMGCAMALGRPVAAATQIEGPARHQGIAPRRMLQALLVGRTAPEGLSPSMLAGWNQVHTDPLPELLGVPAEDIQEMLSARLAPLTSAITQMFR
jgi:predicted ATP-grasp superfamily ATP-dependent carboligase